MFDVPTDKERAFRIASYDCNIMSVHNKSSLTIATGPIGWLGSTVFDALTMKKNFYSCMQKMGFEYRNDNFNNVNTANKKIEEPVATNKIITSSPSANANVDSPAFSSEEDWFVFVDGKRNGPYKISGIKDSLSSDKITSDTLIWKYGMTGWKRIGEIENLNR